MRRLVEEIQGVVWVQNGTKTAMKKMAKHLEGLTGMDLDVGIGVETKSEIRGDKEKEKGDLKGKKRSRKLEAQQDWSQRLH